MRARATAVLGGALAAALLLASVASADFGLKEQQVIFTNKDGSLATQAGSHPYAMTTILEFNTVPDPKLKAVPVELTKDVVADLPPGFAVKPKATPRCSSADFLTVPTSAKTGEPEPLCPLNTIVGVFQAREAGEQTGSLTPVYNLEPPPGVASKLGFRFSGVSAVIEGGLRGEGDRNLYATVSDISQVVPITGSKLTLWGIPADPDHDPERGYCLATKELCPSGLDEQEPFITLPRSCTGPLASLFAIDSWLNPGVWAPGVAFTAPMSGCGKLAFSPSITTQPSTRATQSPSGLDFGLELKDEGINNPKGIAGSDVKQAVVTLPEGFTTNPSAAAGLGVCSQADLARESATSNPGQGCPESSKIGSVEVETPLLDESVNGSLYIATPYENEFGSLIALYMVIRNRNLGIMVKQGLKVEPDPNTGRLTTVAENLPQLPFSHFRLHFREGARAPLATPPGCGPYNATAELYPWSGGPPVTSTSAFQITTGPAGGSCPSGKPPFKPDFLAGTTNNAAGDYSPFTLRIARGDSEGELSRFSVKLPPGVIGKIAGIPYCSEASIAAARARTGPNGGQEEIDRPSCPAASEIGSTLAGAGVGPALSYAPGKIYLAGPFGGAALSIVAITAAKVGPFDLGTVVIRQALKIDPESAEVSIEASGSDPIPRIIKGVPVHTREIRADVSRPDFVLNPTGCKPSSSAATMQSADNQSVTVTSPFQAADCAALGFGPKLALSLKGGTKRGANPKFKAVLTYPKGSYANIARAQVTLPHSEFLDQSHIKTICTRVQFAAGQKSGEKCPPGSIYGFAKASTPLLSEPLQGPVFLRSSSNPLPDLVAALHNSQVDFNLVGRIDSVRGGIRNTFETVPDAPVSKFTLEMRGGKKGLLVNSTNICKGKHRAKADFTGQNGKKHVFKPLLKAKCPKKGR